MDASRTAESQGRVRGEPECFAFVCAALSIFAPSCSPHSARCFSLHRPAALRRLPTDNRLVPRCCRLDPRVRLPKRQEETPRQLYIARWRPRVRCPRVQARALSVVAWSTLHVRCRTDSSRPVLPANRCPGMATGARKRRRGSTSAASSQPAPQPPVVDPTAAAVPPTDLSAPPPHFFKSANAPQPFAAPGPLPAIPNAPPPPASRPLPLRFDAPFTQLDDDIIDDGGAADDVASSANTRRAAGKRSRSRSPMDGLDAVRRSTRQQRGKQAEAPPTPLSADAMVPSSLPSTPASPESSAPTAVNSPASNTTSGRQLIHDLSLLVQQQPPPLRGEDRDEDGRGRSSTRSRGGRAKQSAVEDGAEKNGQQRRGGASKGAGKRSKQTNSAYIDTTNAQDIRALMRASKQAQPNLTSATTHAPATAAADELAVGAYDVHHAGIATGCEVQRASDESAQRTQCGLGGRGLVAALQQLVVIVAVVEAVEELALVVGDMQYGQCGVDG